MSENLKKNYFLLLKLGYMAVMIIYFVTASDDGIAAGLKLLMLSVTLAVSVGYELSGQKTALLVTQAALAAVIIAFVSGDYILLAPPIILDAAAKLRLSLWSYLIPFAAAAFAGENTAMYVLLCVSCVAVYIQQYIIIDEYKNRFGDYEKQESMLKDSLDISAQRLRAENEQTSARYERMMLEERNRLTHELHDQLGHSINGSIYQLEACRAIAEAQPGKSCEMIGSVIDEMRTGMDKLRAILRSERPDSGRMSLIQLMTLCEDCRRSYNIDATAEIDGEASRIPERIWDIILDNCCEAVTNSLRYSGCKSIRIKITVMNKMVRCSVSDDGCGCAGITDGMGIQGMKQRARSVGGTVDADGTNGFTVSMLLPISTAGNERD